MNNKQKRNNIKSRYYIKGLLSLQSPMIVASGENEVADSQIVRDWDGNIIIPGTTLAGNIRHLLVECAKNSKMINRVKKSDLIDKYFGSENDNSGHSLFSFFDAIALSVTTDIRDGVKLDNLTKTTEYGSKYDYEIINDNSTFEFRMGIVSRELTDENELESIASKTIELLENCELRIGAKTSRGFGKIQLSNTKIQKIDIRNESQKWIDFSWNKLAGKYDLNKNESLFEKIKDFKLTANFAIVDSLIIKSYSTDPNDVDSVSLTSNGNPIISGTSWNGAIRHALENVGRELNKHDEMLKLIKNCFGWINNNIAIPSKVIIDESEIKKGELTTYTRNKVDRFTGGVVNSALFDEKPVYGGTVELNCSFRNPEDHEIGLLILAIKELQNGIQTVGGESNIGRGCLEGKLFNISEKEQQKYLNALGMKINDIGDK